MHYWNLLWDWNALDAVRTVHSAFELSALIFFALLVMFDVLAHLSDANKTLEKRLERLGLICFAIAVLAELVAYPYSKRNDELSGNEIKTLSELASRARVDADGALGTAKTASKESSNAKGDAGKAKDTAAIAESLARGARQEADSFEASIQTARKEAADALANLAEAKRLAEEAQKGTARLTDRFADRTLTDEQAARIAVAVRPFAGQELDVTPYRDIPESLNIANRILGIVTSTVAGWQYKPDANPSFLMGGVSGVQVWTHPDAEEKVKNAADRLVAALVKEGISAERRQENPANPKENKIHLNIGTKQ